MVRSEKNWGSYAGGLFLSNHMPVLDQFVHDFALVMGVYDDQEHLSMGQLMIAIAPDPITNGQFQTRLEDLIEEIMRQENVRLPGDRRLKLREKASRSGIQSADKQYQTIISLCMPETEDQ